MEKKIKSAEEIIAFVFPHTGEELGDNYSSVIDAMKSYAAQAIEAQLEIAAEEARTEVKLSSIDFTPISNEPEVDKDSIRNCTRITLE